ncbi:LysR family transcriptional regulator [Streptomyces meridianus]|uniref:LysR family transcriptional regulator n=1 Tax=Streptomyces meridianus TaxID=2938945 RepID=A0ABT0X9S6_9ACTN|nr:LysR family transcriptional regulator [Streptomyces meridianus]MCM2579276.1 LysR family transcriptional regulator [Streptomyces meridianus]
MLDVRRLRLLRELSLRGTIAAVADALAFTPSAVSQQLSALEREAGVALLERTGRRVVLTPAGRNLVRHAEVVLERLEQASAELVDARRGLAGPLRIGTFPTAARAIVPTALTTLAVHHPGLEPMVSEIDPAGVANALRAGELDVALVHDYDFVPSPAEPGLATEPLCTESLSLAAPSAGAFAGTPAGACGTAEGAAVSHWRDAPWITATPGTLCHAMTLRACQAAGFTPRTRHQVDEFATVLALVAAGQGVALVPELGVGKPVPGVTLTRLPIHRRTRIAFRRGAAGHPAVAAITTALRAAVPPELRIPS